VDVPRTEATKILGQVIPVGRAAVPAVDARAVFARATDEDSPHGHTQMISTMAGLFQDLLTRGLDQ